MLNCPDCGIPNPDDWHTCVQYENNQKVEKQIKLLQMQVENLHERMSGVEQMIQAYGKELMFRAPWKEQ